MFNLECLEQAIMKDYPTHPFSSPRISSEQLRPLLENYFAMSQAFPYIQAGSQRNLIYYCLERNMDIPPQIELTTVVGNFLAWDETGGFYTVLREGLSALPEILNTSRFHSNILRKDLEKIFGEAVLPEYSRHTREYLRTLDLKLSSLNAVERVACMVSFEWHAQRMIESLWESIHRITALEKNELVYFHIHVGGDDPAEGYHVAMTQRLIDKTIDIESREIFMLKCLEDYGAHINWCENISRSENIINMSSGSRGECRVC